MDSGFENLDLNDSKCVSSIMRLIESHISNLQDELAKEKRMRQAAEARCKNLQMLFQSAKNECCCKLQPAGAHKSYESVKPEFDIENRCINQSSKGIATRLWMGMVSPSGASSSRAVEIGSGGSVKPPQQKQILRTVSTENLKRQMSQCSVENMDIEETPANRPEGSNKSLKERNYNDTAIEKQRIISAVVGKSLTTPPNKGKCAKKSLKLSLNSTKNRPPLNKKDSSQVSNSTEKAVKDTLITRFFPSEDLFQVSDSDTDDGSNPCIPTKSISNAVDKQSTKRVPPKNALLKSEDEADSVFLEDSEESDCNRTQFNIKHVFSVDCKDCQKLVDFLGADITVEKAKQIIDKCKRHNDAAAIPNTPPDFWNPKMRPDNESEALIDYRFVKKGF